MKQFKSTKLKNLNKLKYKVNNNKKSRKLKVSKRINFSKSIQRAKLKLRMRSNRPSQPKDRLTQLQPNLRR